MGKELNKFINSVEDYRGHRAQELLTDLVKDLEEHIGHLLFKNRLPAASLSQF